MGGTAVDKKKFSTCMGEALHGGGGCTAVRGASLRPFEVCGRCRGLPARVWTV